MIMNQEITQLNSLTSSMKIAENDLTKLKERYDILEKDDTELKKQLGLIEQDYAAEEERFKKLKTEVEEDNKKMNEEIAQIQEKLKERKQDEELYFELKKLEEEIKKLQNSNEFLEKEIIDVQEGKNTPGYRAHLHKTLSPEDKEKLLDQLTKNLVINKHQGFLTLSSIKSIFDATVLYHSKDYIARTYQDRIERRKVLNDDEKYIDLVLKQLDEFDVTVDNSQLEILNKKGMTLDEFSSNIEFYFTNGNQDIYIMTTQVPQKLRLFIPSRKRLTQELIRDVLLYEKEILEKEFEILKILEKKKEGLTPDIAYTIIFNRLSDRVYEKFNIEEEDLTKSININSVNAEVEIISLLKEIRARIYERLPKADSIFA